MAKFVIINDNGEILRTVNLPYEGTLIDISQMSDAEWESWYNKLHKVKVEMKAKGEYKKDGRNLPIIIERQASD